MNNHTYRDTDTGAPRLSRRVELALAVLEQVREQVAGGRPADSALQAIFRKHREYGSRDRRFYAGMVFPFFRWLGWLADLSLVRTCALVQMLDAEEINEDLKALCEAAGIPAIPMGFLSLDQKALETGKILGRKLSAGELLPPGILDHIPLPAELQAPFIRSMQIRPPVWLRCIEPETAKWLSANGAKVHPNVPEAVALPNNFNRGLLNTPEGQRAEVQDLSSQCAGLIAVPRRGESWWDVCAGAGGKTLHLAALTGGQADILASDIRESSLSRLAARAKRTGMKGLRTALLDGTKDHPGRSGFDGIIVDAPCSGIGTWPRNPDARWRFAPETISQSAEVQKNILRNVSQYLRTEGCLIYAVCTCTFEETGAVTTAFLDENRNFEPAGFTHPLTGADCRGQCMIWPEDGPCNGMFIAKFRKVGDPAPKQQPIS